MTDNTDDFDPTKPIGMERNSSDASPELQTSDTDLPDHKYNGGEPKDDSPEDISESLIEEGPEEPEITTPYDDLNSNGENESNEVEKPKKPKIKVTVKKHNHNATIGDYEVDRKIKDGETPIVLPPDFGDKMMDVLNNMSMSAAKVNEDFIQWFNATEQCSTLLVDHELLSDTLDNNGNWRQGVEFNGVTLETFEPNLKRTNSGKIGGEIAELMLRRKLGLGTHVTIPLWHSGFWVNLFTPSEGEWINLMTAINDDSINIGRDTYGAIYSGRTSISAHRIYDFIVEHIKWHTVDLGTDTQLSDLIKIQDLQPLIRGLLASQYPKGHMYSRPCTSNDDTCTSITDGVINFKRLEWTDNNALTDAQKKHMTKVRPRAMSVKDIHKYQDEFDNMSVSETWLGDDIAVKFTSPNLTRYFETTETWITSIVNMVSEVLSEDSEESDRNAKMYSHMQSSILNEYNHWVKSISIDGNVGEKDDDIATMLTVMSSDDETREKLNEAVREYITKSTISLVGIPEYNCPKCSKPQIPEEDSKHGNIIPLDLIALFFVLGGSVISKIAAR